MSAHHLLPHTSTVYELTVFCNGTALHFVDLVQDCSAAAALARFLTGQDVSEDDLSPGSRRALVPGFDYALVRRTMYKGWPRVRGPHSNSRPQHPAPGAA